VLRESLTVHHLTILAAMNAIDVGTIVVAGNLYVQNYTKLVLNYQSFVNCLQEIALKSRCASA
jgi:hypothetical protein